MIEWFSKRLGGCIVLLLALAIFPAGVLANDNIVTREMLPGDVASGTVNISALDEENVTTSNSIEAASSFTPRFTAPTRDNAYYYENNLYYQNGYGMPNCTAYAWGRAYELLGSVPNLSKYNANQWWSYNLDNSIYAYGSTPKLGAIACWGGSECGHVAVVEAISGNKVTISESSWSGCLFDTDTYTIGSENATSVGGFQGYIYLNDFYTDTTSPTIANAQITDVDAEGFTVTCNVSDNDSGIDYVMFPTWTDANGQDDITWNKGTIDGDTAKCRILYSDHNNESGAYTVHIYAYDKAGLSSAAPIGVIVKSIDNSALKSVSASYQTQIQDIGWQDLKKNGEISGTSGQSKRLEGIKINVNNQGYDVGVAYSTHIENIGWQDYVSNGDLSGTVGQCLRLEAIKINLTGADASKFDIYYRVHAENFGWLDWAKNGEESGTAGYGYRLEAIEIQIVPHGDSVPADTTPVDVTQTFVQNV
ncbi:CHAP domain-containing protein [Acetobacterium paludosum]|uniref:CHAP domain-containing protein n=1 Tax=Acetobacterium paludosum TaxID=52693 RepID=A0A923KNN6_9FIRM|nr:GBS Bsp-like repeat-containing protein [Acetobacterium paludosum]MBC3887299.1 CHAP domain-containing protein [Acetobacterium paludosum]